MRRLPARLDQTARTINTRHLAVAIGLDILDFTTLLSKSAEALAVTVPAVPPLHPVGKQKVIDPAQWPGGAAGL